MTGGPGDARWAGPPAGHSAVGHWYARLGGALSGPYAGADPCHGLAHVIRVALLAERIARQENVALDLCVLAALFHDAGHAASDAAGVDDHELRSAALARTALADVLGPLDLDEVASAIEGRRFSKLCQPRSAVGAVLDDADNLDAIGLTGVGRAYLWLGAHHRGPDEAAGAELAGLAEHDLRALRRHWDEKLSGLRNCMRTSVGRQLAVARHAVMADFLRELQAETATLWDGFSSSESRSIPCESPLTGPRSDP